MFKYDEIIDENDICNYESEKGRLRKFCDDGEKVVLYAPRRYGKTSLLINVVGKHFLNKNKSKKPIFCYINLQEVKDMNSIFIRFAKGLAEALSMTFPIKNLLSSFVDFFKLIRPQIDIDSISGAPTLKFVVDDKKHENITNICNSIRKFSAKYPLLLVLDEFQDISQVSESEALLRESIQKITGCPIFISGSKKHLLNNIFFDEKKPFYNWGNEIELRKIKFDKWKKYILSRFKTKKITITDENLHIILDHMYFIPNYICKICSGIYNYHPNSEITPLIISDIMHSHYIDTQNRYAEKVAFLTKKQTRFLAVIAKEKIVKEIASKKMIAKSGISNKALSDMSRLFLDKGYLEREEDGLRIADPFFAYYLALEF